MRVNHDFHIHTNLSLCAPDKTGTVENYIQSAKKHGLNKLGFANHFWGSEPGDPEYYKTVKMNPNNYYLTQNFEYISQIRPELEKYNSDEIKLAKILGPGKTVVTVLPDTAERYFSTPLFE